MAAILCAKCGRELSERGAQARVASIAGSIMGDEYVYSYYFCARCQVYTVESNHDRFSGDESAAVRGPVSKADGDAKVALIQRCAAPLDKHCRCEAHLAYFGNNLD